VTSQVQVFVRRSGYKRGGLKLATLLEMMLYVQVSLAGFLGFGPFLYGDRLGQETPAAALLYPIRSLATVGIFGLALLFGGRPPRTIRAVILLIYVLYLACTTLWSVDRAITARAAVDMAAICISLSALCNGLPVSRSINVLLNVLVATLVVSSLLAVAMPAIGVMGAYDSWSEDQAGAWRGLFVEKNALGGTAAIGLIVMVRSWRVWTIPAIIKAGGVVAALVCFIFSRSANAWVGLVAMGVATILFAGNPSRIRAAITWTMLSAIVAVMATSSAVLTALDFLGRDTTFNGRTPIWETSIELWQNAWLTGYGYVAGTSKTLQPILLQTHGVAARHAHSGYIEALVETGVIGLLLFVLLILACIWRASTLPRSTPPLDRQATTSFFMILLGSMVMAGGDVNGTRLVGGWGAITWTALICTACLPSASGFLRGRAQRWQPRSDEVVASAPLREDTA
jgi:exopolysaccharide production protein ExoQ